jgi:hypothetical protein
MSRLHLHLGVSESRLSTETALFALDLSGQFFTALIAPKAVHPGEAIFSGKKRDKSHLLPALRAFGYVLHRSNRRL